jgi:hypothetical protein
MVLVGRKWWQTKSAPGVLTAFTGGWPSPGRYPATEAKSARAPAKEIETPPGGPRRPRRNGLLSLFLADHVHYSGALQSDQRRASLPCRHGHCNQHGRGGHEKTMNELEHFRNSFADTLQAMVRLSNLRSEQRADEGTKSSPAAGTGAANRPDTSSFAAELGCDTPRGKKVKKAPPPGLSTRTTGPRPAGAKPWERRIVLTLPRLIWPVLARRIRAPLPARQSLPRV